MLEFLTTCRHPFVAGLSKQMEKPPFADDDTKHLKVDVKKEYRHVLPSIRLERKNIRMLNPSPGHAPVSDTTSTRDEAKTRTNDGTRIVGEKGPLEEESSSSVAPTNGHRKALHQHEGSEEKRPIQEQAQKPAPTKEILTKPKEKIQELYQPSKHPSKQPSNQEKEKLTTKDRTKEAQEEAQTQTDETTTNHFKGHASRAAAGRQNVQIAQPPLKDESMQALEFFEDKDLSLDGVTSTLLVVPTTHSSTPKGPRSPSPSSLHARVGLSHLDNLIKLMEQLSTLRDENLRLRKKCDYLETTKKLLQARSEMMAADPQPVSYTTLPAKHRHKTLDVRREADPNSGRPRLPSAEDVQSMDISETSSDQRHKRHAGSMHKRSFSTGSLEVEILDETSTRNGRDVLITKSKSGKSVLGMKSPGSKQKAKGSKWARVKKVLTGQKLYEDLGTTIRSLKELGRSAQRYSSVSASNEYSPASSRVTENQSIDSGVSTSLDMDTGLRLPRTSSSSAEVSSAGRSPNQTSEAGLEELGTEIWMGPPGWWEQYEARKQSEASTSSDVSSVIEVKTMYLGSKQKDTERLLRVKPLIRRQSSPSLTTKEDELPLEDDDDLHQVHRSASYKGEDLGLPKVGLGAAVKGERDSKKLHRTAWGRVKEMIHVRKDSVKKRRDRDSLEWSQGEEISEGDLEGLMEEHWQGEFGEGVVSRSTPKTSPVVVPRQPSSKSFSESPPQTVLETSCPSRMATSAGSVEMASLLGQFLQFFFPVFFCRVQFLLLHAICITFKFLYILCHLRSHMVYRKLVL